MSKIFLLFVLLCASCTPQDISEDSRSTLVNGLFYFKDTRTGVCFATYRIGSQYGTMASVECTPEVEQTAELFASPRPSWK